MRRFAVIVSLLLLGPSPAVHAAGPDADVAKISPRVTAFMQTYCFKCHGPNKQKGKLRLDTMSTKIADGTVALAWQDILDKLNLSEMPPEEATQPSKAELANVLETLTANLREARRRLTDSGGHIVLRRMNRREYQQTIEQLFGVPVDVSMLPEDGKVDGFDTLGQAHSFSSLHLERYLHIGRGVLDNVYAGKAARPVRKRSEPEGAAKKIKEELPRLEKKIKDYDKSIAQGKKGHDKRQAITKEEAKLSKAYLARPETTDGTLLPFRGLNPSTFIHIGKVAPTGKFRVKVRCGVVSDKPRDDIFLKVVRGEFRAKVPDELFVFQVSGTQTQPKIIEFTFDVDNIRSNRLAFERRHTQREKLERFADSRSYYFKYQQVAHLLEDELPDVWIDWVEVEGPLPRDPAPLSVAKLFNGDASKLTDADARPTLERFVYEAFRRAKPETAYIDKLMHVYTEARGNGDPVKAALIDAMSVVLASPRFLYLFEPKPDGQNRRPLTDRELAVRLSYFLWSGPPDEELYAITKQDRLRDPNVLAKQVDRMIASPRANQFIEAFTTQWLELERLDGIAPEATPSWEYDELVKEYSRREVFAFFATLLRENLPATNLINSEFAVLNGLMADFYGIEGGAGSKFRKVKLPSDSIRGGLLGQSAILTLTGTGERTSPVERGAFVLRKLLHRPPPPAPANVPMLDEESVGTRSIRDTLSIHMSTPQCNSCHRRIDPLGFGMENFDPVGRWRTQVPSTDGSVQFKVDPSGVMPDGKRKFADFLAMKRHMVQDKDAMLTGLTEAIMTYALGRTIGFTDQEVVERIVRETADDDYRLRNLIIKIVSSRPFLSK